MSFRSPANNGEGRERVARVGRMASYTSPNSRPTASSSSSPSTCRLIASSSSSSSRRSVRNFVVICLLSCWLSGQLSAAYQQWLRDPTRSRDLSRRSYYGGGSPIGGSSSFLHHHQERSSPSQQSSPSSSLVIGGGANGNYNGGGGSGGNAVGSSMYGQLQRRVSCNELRGVLINKQVKFCQNHPDFMKSVILGERDALKECQHQFKTRRWNCSTLEESWVFPAFRSNQQGMAEIAKLDASTIVLPADVSSTNSSSSPSSLSNGNGNSPASAALAASATSNMQRDSAAVPSDGNSLDSSYASEKDFKKRRKVKARGRLGPLPIVPQGTREQAFVSAISSSGVAHAVTRACSSGMLRECGCDESLRGRSAEGFKWSGCSDNIGYGTMFSKTFVDAKDIRVSRRKRQKFAKELIETNGKRKRGTMNRRMASVARAIMNLHNNDAGREIIAHNMKIDCKCHGVSGSCEMKTCWRSMPSFREIGEVLKDKFDGASEVRPEMVGKKMSLVPRDQGFKPYGKSDLIYINRSPDFCELNLERGSLGTHGRQCNKTSKGIDGCDLLCCNRGYKTHKQRVVEQCNCEFKWCCEVRCEKCVRTVEIHTCK